LIVPEPNRHHPVEDGLGLEASSAALAGAHVDLGADVHVRVDVVGGGLELLGHGDGLLRADVGAAPAVGAALQVEVQPAHRLLVGDDDQPRGADIGAAGAADALGHVYGQLAPEALHRQGLDVPFQGIGKSDPQVLEADDGFFQFGYDHVSNSFLLFIYHLEFGRLYILSL
jgi:hypothetical protein